MKKGISCFFFFLVLVLVLVPCVLLASESGVEAVPGADLAATLLGYLPDSWNGWVTLIVAICAAISAVWPRPQDSANPVVRLLYAVVNAIGVNIGKAQNADDAAAKASRIRM